MVLAFLYERSREADADRNFAVIEAFSNGKAIECGGVEVNRADYNYISGTNTFTGKPDSQVSMQRYSVGECKVK